MASNGSVAAGLLEERSVGARSWCKASPARACGAKCLTYGSRLIALRCCDAIRFGDSRGASAACCPLVCVFVCDCERWGLNFSAGWSRLLQDPVSVHQIGFRSEQSSLNPVRPIRFHSAPFQAIQGRFIYPSILPSNQASERNLMQTQTQPQQQTPHGVVEQPMPVTPGITKGMVREHAFLLYQDRLPGNHLTLEDWVLAEKDLVASMDPDGVPIR